MNPSPAQTPHKLGANRNEPARKPPRPKSFSESRDLHEDRGAIQSKFARVKTTTPTRAQPRVSVARRRAVPATSSNRAPAKLLPEHASGPEFHVVHLRLCKTDAHQVCVAGSFNDWKPEETPLQREADGGWDVALSLAPGEYEYRFVVDGKWTDDPLARRHASNPFGSQNAVLHVGHVP